MNIYYDIESPAWKEAGLLASDFGLKNHGLKNFRKAYWNLPTGALYEEAIFRGEGRMAEHGPLVVLTGKHTGRSAADKYIVREQKTEEHVWWGEYNRPYNPENFNALLARMQAFFQGRDVFVQDLYAGADPANSVPIRIITEKAFSSLFSRTMFLKPQTQEAYKKFVPEFTILNAPSFLAEPLVDMTRSETFIIANFSARLALIGGSLYGGEIKKTIFTVLNFLLPMEGVMSMHCSANVGPDGDTALFFGLSGTGKTTLSADPRRRLIGDDEHGWNDNGIFNFEDGCYAKVIRLSASAEPQIYACTRRFGTVIENVVMDPMTRKLDLNDDRITENTRAAYPLYYIDNAVPEKMAGHPKNVIFLTCDASGVMPPIAKLTPEQALYHFISGYTSKLAGTEMGLGVEPEITFSTCFGAPFMVHHPHDYAELLRSKIVRHGADCWLVNTGWTGGPFGIGKRLSIGHTRQLLNSRPEGKLKKVKFRKDPVFGFDVSDRVRGRAEGDSRSGQHWGDRDEYLRKYDALAARFIENFKLFAGECPAEVAKAGPKRLKS
jgi:phosphoenolpyruvate carboxykinase (ATP)